MLTLGLIAAALLIAFANGGNDNAKGVATLIGSRILEFRSAIRFANVTTLLGALTAIPMALYVNSTLIKAFGGAGLLPKSFAVDAHYLLAVGFGAACTLLIATRLGFPISTTHSLIGALVGAGLIAVGPQRLVWIALGSKFVIPLLLSPILAAALALILYPLFRRLLAATGGQKLCLCVEQTYVPVVSRGGVLMLATSGRALSVAEVARCERVATEKLLAFSADEFVKAGQFFTSGLVFVRSRFERYTKDRGHSRGCRNGGSYTQDFWSGAGHRIRCTRNAPWRRVGCATRWTNHVRKYYGDGQRTGVSRVPRHRIACPPRVVCWASRLDDARCGRFASRNRAT